MQHRDWPRIIWATIGIGVLIGLAIGLAGAFWFVSQLKF